MQLLVAGHGLVPGALDALNRGVGDLDDELIGRDALKWRDQSCTVIACGRASRLPVRGEHRGQRCRRVATPLVLIAAVHQPPREADAFARDRP